MGVISQLMCIAFNGHFNTIKNNCFHQRLLQQSNQTNLSIRSMHLSRSRQVNWLGSQVTYFLLSWQSLSSLESGQSLCPLHLCDSIIHSPELHRKEQSSSGMHVVLLASEKTVPGVQRHVWVVLLIAMHMCEHPPLKPCWAQVCVETVGAVIAINSMLAGVTDVYGCSMCILFVPTKLCFGVQLSLSDFPDDQNKSSPTSAIETGLSTSYKNVWWLTPETIQFKQLTFKSILLITVLIFNINWWHIIEFTHHWNQCRKFSIVQNQSKILLEAHNRQPLKLARYPVHLRARGSGHRDRSV